MISCLYPDNPAPCTHTARTKYSYEATEFCNNKTLASCLINVWPLPANEMGTTNQLSGCGIVVWIRFLFNQIYLTTLHSKKLCSRLSSSEVWFYTEIGRFVFLRPPLGDLGATHDDHLRLIGKRIVDFLLALLELFSLRVTAEAVRAKTDRKSAILL